MHGEISLKTSVTIYHARLEVLQRLNEDSSFLGYRAVYTDKRVPQISLY
jgi:hypothetical protein